jgi:hypothetical protein
MGIKNIHIILIAASVLLSLVFGFWAVTHDYNTLGYISFALAIGLIVYGIQFLKKAKVL